MIHCCHEGCTKTPQDGVRFYRVTPEGPEWACQEHFDLQATKREQAEAARWDRFFTEHGVKQ